MKPFWSLPKARRSAFFIDELRAASRQSGGVRGIRLAKGDQAVGMEVIRLDEDLLVVTRKGFGKRTLAGQYPRKHRGGQGVKTFMVTAKTGDLVATRMVNSTQEIVIISRDGIIIRTPVEHISTQGRSTQGVTLMDVGQGDAVAAVAVVDLQSDHLTKAASQLPHGGYP